MYIYIIHYIKCNISLYKGHTINKVNFFEKQNIFSEFFSININTLLSGIGL